MKFFMKESFNSWNMQISLYRPWGMVAVCKTSRLQQVHGSPDCSIHLTRSFTPLSGCVLTLLSGWWAGSYAPTANPLTTSAVARPFGQFWTAWILSLQSPSTLRLHFTSRGGMDTGHVKMLSGVVQRHYIYT